MFFQKAIGGKNQHFLWVWAELGKFGLMAPVILKSLCLALNVSLSTHWCAPLQVRSTGEGESCVRAASLPSPTASCCAWTSAPGTRPASSAPCVWARSPGPVTAGTACCTASTTMKSKNTLTDTHGGDKWVQCLLLLHWLQHARGGQRGKKCFLSGHFKSSWRSFPTNNKLVSFSWSWNKAVVQSSCILEMHISSQLQLYLPHVNSKTLNLQRNA